MEKQAGMLGLGRTTSKEYWNAVRELNTGIIIMNPAATMIFNYLSGLPWVNNTQNEQVVKDHFEHVFNLPSMYDATVLNSIRQRDSMEHLDLELSDMHTQAGKACGDSGIRADFWHALESDVHSREIFYMSTVTS